MFPHLKLLDLFNKGVLYECAVMQEAPNGDIYHIRIDWLDEIDRVRLRQILSRRDAANYPLWDLMSQVTLQNGVNALTFFQQFVRVLTPSGQIFTPNTGRVGASRKVVDAQAAAKMEDKKVKATKPEVAKTEVKAE